MGRSTVPAASRSVLVQLRWLAHARSGDKGNTANVGLIALEPEYYPVLVEQVTAARVARHFRGMVSRVDRFELPNLHALNFLLHDSLGGGGTLRAGPGFCSQRTVQPRCLDNETLAPRPHVEHRVGDERLPHHREQHPAR